MTEQNGGKMSTVNTHDNDLITTSVRELVLKQSRINDFFTK